jgi:hypothetical protein
LAGRLKEKAKMPGIKDKVKNLKSKVHIPGTKHGDDNAEYDDDNSPRSDSATVSKRGSSSSNLYITNLVLCIRNVRKIKKITENKILLLVVSSVNHGRGTAGLQVKLGLTCDSCP